MGLAVGLVGSLRAPSPDGPAGAARVVARATEQVLDVAGAQAWLSLTPQERHRAGLLHQARDRDDFVAAHHLVRVVAAELLGGEPRELVVRQTCHRCPRDHGRPSLPAHPGTHVSWAHSRGAVVAAAGPYLVGVDLERVGGSVIDHDVAQAVLTDDELRQGEPGAHRQRSWLQGWVRKEALVKVGLLTLDTARSLDLSALPFSPSGRAQPVGRDELHLTDLQLPDLDAVAAVAVYDGRRVDVA